MSILIGNGGTADKIEAITTGATVQVDYHVTQVNKAQADTNPTSAKGVVTNGQIASATTTKITTDPAASNEAMIRQIVLTNTHASASCAVQLQHTIGAGTARKLGGAYTLQPGEKLEYNSDGTMNVYDAMGGAKTAQVAPSSVTVLTSGSGTYNTPAGAKALRVRLIAGGGAGGGCSSVASSGGGGGGGGSGSYCEKVLSPPASSYSYAIGAGGTAGTAGATAGNNGGDTTFGTLTAKGGTGGAGCTAAVATRAMGGAGGIVGSNGDINLPGEAGDNSVNTTAALVASGSGGNSKLGGGANGVSSQGAGTSAVANSGGGGSGGASISAGAAVAGGVGGSGIIVVEEYF